MEKECEKDIGDLLRSRIHEESIVSTPQLKLPDDFEHESYEAVSSLITPLRERYQLQCKEFTTAWHGVANRFRACAEHDEAFTRSIKKNDSPQQPERYYQERELFGFFINGLSMVESTCYGLYAIGSILKEQYFPIKKPKNMRAITPERTADRFRTTFPNEGISCTLNEVIESQEYDDWKDCRNILAHRGTPGREFQRTIGSGADTHGDTLWLNGIPLDASTTRSRRAWLADTLQMLLREAHSFASTKEF
jgi:hypothetical protein